VQVLALRLAVLFCHARCVLLEAPPRIALQGSVAILTLDPAWASANPRGIYLLREEAQAWARTGDLTLQIA
jgi:exopolyphosphatase/guanosine-5'-triphosphate,3'-diphosphate pyrophosphatase